jgi:predicted acetyltransferase
MNNLQLIEATKEHRNVLRALFDLYAHDFSPMTGADVQADGRYTPNDFLTGWWDAHGEVFHPFLLKVDGQWAGFAWVEEGSYIEPDNDDVNHWLMEEFFIVRKYRGKGVGEWFARALFERFPGTWEVGEMHPNMDAQRFWRMVIGRYAGEYDEITVNNDRWDGPVQRFSKGVV